MIAFIDEHGAVDGVEPICRVLPIAPSTYHAHAACRADPARASARARNDMDRNDMELCRAIQPVWDEIVSGHPTGLGRKLSSLRCPQDLAAVEAGGARCGTVYGGPPDAAPGPEGRDTRQGDPDDGQ
jgi:hypothetical protein